MINTYISDKTSSFNQHGDVHFAFCQEQHIYNSRWANALGSITVLEIFKSQIQFVKALKHCKLTVLRLLSNCSFKYLRSYYLNFVLHTHSFLSISWTFKISLKINSIIIVVFSLIIYVIYLRKFKLYLLLTTTKTF